MKGGALTPSQLSTKYWAWCWAHRGQSVKTYWHGQAASPIAEWLKGPYLQEALQRLSHLLFGQARWKEVTGQSSPPAPSYSDLRTMAASRVQEYFPKLDCAAESPGVVFRHIWLWYPGIHCPQQLSRHGWSPSPQATSWPLPVSKISRSNRRNIDPWRSNTFILKLFFFLSLNAHLKSLNVFKASLEK